MNLDQFLNESKHESFLKQACKQRVLTWDELNLVLDRNIVDEERIETVIDFFEQQGIELVSEREKKWILKTGRRKKKHKRLTPLNPFNKNDQLGNFMKIYDHLLELTEDEKQRQIMVIRREEKILEDLLFRSLYLLYFLYGYRNEEMTPQALENLLNCFQPNFLKAVMIYDRQIAYFRQWFDDQWQIWTAYAQASQKQQDNEAESLMKELLDQLVSLNWKSKKLRSLLNDFIREDGFFTLANRKEEEYGFLVAYLKDYQKETRKHYDRLQEKRNSLIESEMKLVISIAKLYSGRGIDFVDLIQEGNRGLVEALDNYTTESQAPFQQYVTRYIRRAITHYMACNSNSFVISRQQLRAIHRIKRVRNQLTQELHRDPTPEEIVQHCGIPLHTVNNLLNASKRETSWENQLNLSRTEFHLTDDQNKTVEISETWIKRLENIRLSQTLSDREEKVMKLKYGYYGVAYPEEEISEILGLTIQRIRQIEKIARHKMKSRMKLLKIDGYVVLP